MDSQKKNILLVEDEPMIREMYELVLSQRDYSVDLAEDGEVALNKINKNDSIYDLILLDIMLPKVNGIEVLKEIKSKDSHLREVPVYLLTNLGQGSIIEAAFELGAAGYIIKSKHLPSQIADKIDNLFRKEPA